ncbi:MAG: POTRA domain-containing protein [Bacteriovoracaceae bacterium]
MILFLLTLLFSFSTWAYEINQVEVSCSPIKICQFRKKQFKALKGEYRSYLHFRESIKIIASDGGYKSFKYDIDENKKLSVHFELKPIVKSVGIVFPGSSLDMDPYDVVKFKEGEFFEPSLLGESKTALEQKLDSLGYPDHQVQIKVIDKNEFVDLSVIITLEQPRVYKGLSTSSKSEFVNNFLHRKFLHLYDQPFDYNRFRLLLDEAQKDLFSYGYYLVHLEMSPVVKQKKVELEINVENDQFFTFDFEGIQRETRDQLLGLITGLFKQYKRPVSESIVRLEIQEYYKKIAYLNVKVQINRSVFKNKYQEDVLLYKVRIDEGQRTRLTNVTFSGSSYFNESKIKNFYEKEAFELASLNYYDVEYLNYFIDFLKRKYISEGYVQIKVIGPHTSFNEDKSKARVEYIIQEGRQASVRNIQFTGVPAEYESDLHELMKNNIGKPFNPIDLTDDIKEVNQFLQNKGYFFAEVSNVNDDSIVTYSTNGAEVDVHLIVNLGPMVRLNRPLFIGNLKTQRRVLEKKIVLDKGDIITPQKTQALESSLSSTGLFNSVSVYPLKHTSSDEHTDLIVRVSERDYGLIEIAPGYRTDLGVKLSATASYQNIAGANQALTLRSQINQRLDYQTLDQNRRKQNKRLLEHNNSLTYNKSDLFDTMIDLQAGLAYQRRRFYSFDADIARFNTTFTRDLSKRVSASLRYQLEAISQFNATEDLDNGSFKIGAITPSLTFDLRNSQVNPTAGAFFNMSVEYANPNFGSQETKDLTINYYKLISRNRFYVPFKNGTVAISLVGGIQENLSRETIDGASWEGGPLRRGYIPNIKVFRLSGMDIVRGFQDEEINRMPDGRDISEFRVQNRAYLANLKIEPRYFINDKMIIGAFYDAGRVFVDSVDLGDLRDSVGITFKILTPVGTLDFDYGIKLLRKKGPDGRLEDPGRFHVSIGFF